MNPEHIQAALKALRPVTPGAPDFHDDEAPGDAVAPWLVGSLEMPDPNANLAGGSHGGVARWWVTVAAETGGQARVFAQQAIGAWGAKRVTVPGYSPFTLVHRTASGPYPAGRTVTDTDLRYQVVRLGFDLLAARTAA